MVPFQKFKTAAVVRQAALSALRGVRLTPTQAEGMLELLGEGDRLARAHGEAAPEEVGEGDVGGGNPSPGSGGGCGP